MSIVKKSMMSLVAGKLFALAAVVRAEAVSKHFRIIELESDVLSKANVDPGDKIGILINGEKRCYTPIAGEPGSVRLKLAVYLHGRGPGSDWAASLRRSDTCRFAGPRPSLDLVSVKDSCVLFGDETSFAVASALQGHLEDRHAFRFIFEVNSTEEASEAVEALGLRNTMLIERRLDQSHLLEVSANISQSSQTMRARHVVLTGCGPSIQTVRRDLSEAELRHAKSTVKAYWAPGKVGLD